MTWECYTTIIDQLASIGYNGRVALMLSNEPLLEERLEDMIKYAKTHVRLILKKEGERILLQTENDSDLPAGDGDSRMTIFAAADACAF